MCRKPHTGLLHGIYSPEAHEESGTCQRHGCCQYPAFALPFSGSNVPARSSDPCMPEVDTGRPRLFLIWLWRQAMHRVLLYVGDDNVSTISRLLT